MEWVVTKRLLFLRFFFGAVCLGVGMMLFWKGGGGGNDGRYAVFVCMKRFIVTDITGLAV